MIEGLQDPEQRVHGVHRVALAVAVPHGRVAVFAAPAVVFGASERLTKLVPSRPAGVRTRRSPAGRVAVNDRRVEPLRSLVVVLEALGHAGAKIVMNDVSPGHELVDDLGAFRSLQIDGKRALAPLASEER